MFVTDNALIQIFDNRREIWINALKSGQYEQGETYLKLLFRKSAAKYCCLGVACEIFAEDTGITEGVKAEDIPAHGFIQQAYCDINSVDETYMPQVVREYLGLSHRSESLLAALNDSEVPFPIIATTIRYLPYELGAEEIVL